MKTGEKELNIFAEQVGQFVKNAEKPCYVALGVAYSAIARGATSQIQALKMIDLIRGWAEKNRSPQPLPGIYPTGSKSDYLQR